MLVNHKLQDLGLKRAERMLKFQKELLLLEQPDKLIEPKIDETYIQTFIKYIKSYMQDVRFNNEYDIVEEIMSRCYDRVEIEVSRRTIDLLNNIQHPMFIQYIYEHIQAYYIVLQFEHRINFTRLFPKSEIDALKMNVLTLLRALNLEE